MATKTIAVYKNTPFNLNISRANGFYDYNEEMTLENNNPIDLRNLMEEYNDNVLNVTLEMFSNSMPYRFRYEGILPDRNNIDKLYGCLMPFIEKKDEETLDGYVQSTSDTTLNNFDKTSNIQLDDNDIASGFDTSNYISISQSVGKYTTKSKWFITFTTDNDISSHGNILDGMPEIFVSNNQVKVWSYSSDSVAIGNVQSNKTYSIEFTHNESEFSARLYDYETQSWSESVTGVYDNNVGSSMFFGRHKSNVDCWFRGTIDLKNTYIETNGQEVWTPYKTTYKKQLVNGVFYNYEDDGSAQRFNQFILKTNDGYYSLLSKDSSIVIDDNKAYYIRTVNVPRHKLFTYSSKLITNYENYTTVGNPQIDSETGIVSNFTSDNYIIVTNLSFPDKCSFYLKFKVNELPTTDVSIVDCSTVFGIYMDANDMTLKCWNWGASTGENISYTIETDTWYWVRCRRDFSTHIKAVDISTDGNNYTEVFSTTDGSDDRRYRLVIGSNDNSRSFINGIIDISDCKLVDENKNLTIWQTKNTQENYIWTNENGDEYNVGTYNRYLSLEYPFDNINEFPTLVDGANFRVDDTLQAISSGPSNHTSVHGSMWNGYIPITTKNKPMNLTIEARISSEGNYDFGGIYVGTQIWSFNRDNISQGLTDGHGDWLLRGSGDISLQTYSKILEPNQTYYINCGYGKDGSGSTNEDSLIIKSINVKPI